VEKYLFLLIAGLASELLWAWATMAIQARKKVLSVILAIVFPFVSLFVTAITVVDEKGFWPRVGLTAVYSLGAAIGIIGALCFQKK